MKIEYLLIGVALFGLVIWIGADMFGGMMVATDTPIDSGNTFGALAQQSANVQYGASAESGSYQSLSSDMRSKIQGGDVSSSNAVDDMVAGGYESIRNNPFYASDMFSKNATIFVKETHIVSSPVLTFLLFCLGVIVVTSILYLVFGRVK